MNIHKYNEPIGNALNVKTFLDVIKTHPLTNDNTYKNEHLNETNILIGYNNNNNNNIECYDTLLTLLLDIYNENDINELGYIYIYICMCMCKYVCVYMYVCMYVYMYVCMYICMYVCIYMYMYVHACVCI